MAEITAQRRKAIRDILESEEVGSQAHLLELLQAQGIATTQPLVSRDLRALHVAKRDGRYVLTERVTRLETLAPLLRDVRPAGANLIVIVCEPGAAAAVARALEAEEPDGLVGTVAGDDSVFVAVEDADQGEAIQERLLSLID